MCEAGVKVNYVRSRGWFDVNDLKVENGRKESDLIPSFYNVSAFGSVIDAACWQRIFFKF
jgi:hypothetical protein